MATGRKPQDFVRVSSSGLVAGLNTKVVLVRHVPDLPDWSEWHTEEIDLSNFVVSVGAQLKVGEACRVDVSLLVAQIEVDGVIDDLALKHVYPTRLGRIRWRMLKWWRGYKRRDIVDVTSFGSNARQYISGLR